MEVSSDRHQLNGMSELIEIIEESISSGGKSLRWLSDRSKVPYSNLHRTKNGLRKPTYQELIQILKATGGEEKIDRLLKELFPNDKRVLKSDVIKAANVPFSSFKFDEALLSEQYFGILATVSVKGGSHVSTILENYGKFGLQKIDELIELGVVTKEGEFIHGPKHFQPSLEVIKESIKKSIDFHKENNMGTNSNQIFWNTFKTNKEKREWIYFFIRNFRFAIKEMMSTGRVTEKTATEIHNLTNKRLPEINYKSKDLDTIFLSLAMDDYCPSSSFEGVLQ